MNTRLFSLCRRRRGQNGSYSSGDRTTQVVPWFIKIQSQDRKQMIPQGTLSPGHLSFNVMSVAATDATQKDQWQFSLTWPREEARSPQKFITHKACFFLKTGCKAIFQASQVTINHTLLPSNLAFCRSGYFTLQSSWAFPHLLKLIV